MTKIWTLSTGGTGGRVCSASNLIVENRAEGDPVTQFLVVLRKIVSSYTFLLTSPRPPPHVFLFNFSLSASLLLELNANAPLTSRRFSLICFHFESVGDDSFLRISWRRIVETVHRYRRKLRFWKLASLLTPTPALSSPFSPIDRAFVTKIRKSCISSVF